MRKVVASLRDEGISIVDIARALHLPVAELNAFISGFATLPVNGGRIERVRLHADLCILARLALALERARDADTRTF